MWLLKLKMRRGLVSVARRYKSNVIRVENPYNFEVVEEIPYLTSTEIDQKLSNASSFYKQHLPFEERVKQIENLKAYLSKVNHF